MSALSYFFDTPDNVIFGDWQHPGRHHARFPCSSGRCMPCAARIQGGGAGEHRHHHRQDGALIFFCVAILLAFNMETFTLDLWGRGPELGSVMDRVKSTMKVTLWVFIGIEGAVSGLRPCPPSQGRGPATVLALLSPGALRHGDPVLQVMNQPQLAALKNPPPPLIQARGRPGVPGSINIGLVISVMGAPAELDPCWRREVPHRGQDRRLPGLVRQGEQERLAPGVALVLHLPWCTFLIIIYFQSSTHLALVNIATSAALVPYVFSGATGSSWR